MRGTLPICAGIAALLVAAAAAPIVPSPARSVSTAATGSSATIHGGYWGQGPPVFMYFSDRPEGIFYTINGRGYGIAWGSVRVKPWDRQNRTEWYTMEACKAVWWDIYGDVHYIAKDPIPVEVDGILYHFVAAVTMEYRPELGMVEVQAYCLEFYEWMLDNPGEPTDDWLGPRYVILLVSITPPWADFNGDGFVNSLDVRDYLRAYAEQRNE